MRYVINQTKTSRQSRAFTLIELLVVISIIALLIALLLPVLERAKESGYRIRCGAQLHQWYLAIRTYASDNVGDFPGVTAWGCNDLFTDRVDFNGVPEQNWKWMSSYGFAWELTQCPSRKHPRNAWYGRAYQNGGWFATDYYHFFGRGDRPHSSPPIWPIDWGSPAYSYYGWTITYWNFTPSFQNRSPIPNIDKFRRSSKTVLAFDRSWTPTNPGVYYDYPGFDSQSNHPKGSVGSSLWAEGANYLLLDGAVVWDNLTGSVGFIGGHDYYRAFIVGQRLLYP